MGFFEKIVKDSKIIVDKSALLHHNSGVFFANLIPLLQLYQNRVIIPYIAIVELKQMAAFQALNIYNDLKKWGLCSVRGESNDGSSSKVLKKILKKFPAPLPVSHPRGHSENLSRQAGASGPADAR